MVAIGDLWKSFRGIWLIRCVEKGPLWDIMRMRNLRRLESAFCGKSLRALRHRRFANLTAQCTYGTSMLLYNCPVKLIGGQVMIYIYLCRHAWVDQKVPPRIYQGNIRAARAISTSEVLYQLPVISKHN